MLLLEDVSSILSLCRTVVLFYNTPTYSTCQAHLVDWHIWRVDLEAFMPSIFSTPYTGTSKCLRSSIGGVPYKFALRRLYTRTLNNQIEKRQKIKLVFICTCTAYLLIECSGWGRIVALDLLQCVSVLSLLALHLFVLQFSCLRSLCKILLARGKLILSKMCTWKMKISINLEFGCGQWRVNARLVPPHNHYRQ